METEYASAALDDPCKARPPYVCVYASQVAVCVGANRHKKPCEAVEAMWLRVDPKSFHAALARNGVRTEDQNVMDIMARVDGVRGLVDKSLTLPCESSTQVSSNFGAVTVELESVPNLQDEERKLVEDILKRNMYTTFGNVHEQAMLTYIRDTLGIECAPDPTFYKKQIGTVKWGGADVPWFVGGKIDAINSSRTLVVEIKNRINRLFHRVPFYEVVQVQSYLDLLDIEHGCLVECFRATGNPAAPAAQPEPKVDTADVTKGVDTANGPQAPTLPTDLQVNIIPMRRNTKLWREDILPKLQAFVEFVGLLVHDEKLQDKYLQAKRRSLLLSNYVNNRLEEISAVASN